MTGLDNYVFHVSNPVNLLIPSTRFSPFVVDLLHNSDAHLSAVRPNLWNIHRMAQHGQCVKRTWNLGAHFVANLPDAFGKMVDEQGDFAIAQFLVNPTPATGEVRA